MIDRRGSRFAFEVLFLVALAAVLTLTNLSALEIAGVMALGWIIVAAFEWAAWHGEPHYGSGLPPRYYVPTVSLPPAQPLEQVATGGYPDASRDEAPTWIAPAALRAEVLGEWPVAASIAVPEETDKPEPEFEVGEADPWEVPEELPAAPLGELRREPEPVAVGPEPEPEPEPVAQVEEPAPGTVETIPGTEEPELDVVLTRSVQGVARYHLDPLAEALPKRRFARGGAPEQAALEVPARPEGVRALPGRMARQD